MARQIFGRAVDREVRAEFERPHQQRRGEGVVHDQRRARVARDAPRSYRSRPRAAADWRWSRSGCSPACASATAAATAHPDRRYRRSAVSTPMRLEDIHQHADGGAVERIGGDHAICGRSISAVSSAMWMRGHAGGAGERAVAAFERRAPVLPARRRRVVVARVTEARLLAAENAVELLHRSRRSSSAAV